MKFTPKMHFKSDLSIERGVRTLSIIESLEDESFKEDTDISDPNLID